MPNAIEQYDAFRASNDFIFVVFYRGQWCPFCQAYLKQLQSLSGSIAAAGGQIFTVTSEPASEFPKMRALSGYTGEMIADPENLLAKELKRRGVLDVAISDRGGYPHGMAQPAVLVASKTDVYYRWEIVPATMNLGGAKDRPLLNEVWDNVDAQLKGKPQVHATIAQQTLFMGLKQKLFG